MRVRFSSPWLDTCGDDDQNEPQPMCNSGKTNSLAQLVVPSLQDCSMMLCHLCEPITIEVLRETTPYNHQPDLAALKSSADAHCDFCRLLWMCLVQSNGPDAIATQLQGRLSRREEVADTAIRIEMFLLDDGVRARSDLSHSSISVYSGEKGTYVWGDLRLYALEGEKSFLELICSPKSSDLIETCSRQSISQVSDGTGNSEEPRQRIELSSNTAMAELLRQEPHMPSGASATSASQSP